MRRLRMVLSLLVFALVSAVACAEKEQVETAVPEYNEADIIFNMTMIPYQQEAVDMAALTQTNSQNQKLKSLAELMTAEDAPVIADMTARLVLWDVQRREGSRDDIPGLVTPAEMSALKASSGAAFDQMWLGLMIEHHREVIELAETELAEGVDDDTRQLAREFAGTHPAEVVQMEELLVA